MHGMSNYIYTHSRANVDVTDTYKEKRTELKKDGNPKETVLLSFFPFFLTTNFHFRYEVLNFFCSPTYKIKASLQLNLIKVHKIIWVQEFVL
jgi:hypothetical protein